MNFTIYNNGNYEGTMNISDSTIKNGGPVYIHKLDGTMEVVQYGKYSNSIYNNGNYEGNVQLGGSTLNNGGPVYFRKPDGAVDIMNYSPGSNSIYK